MGRFCIALVLLLVGSPAAGDDTDTDTDTDTYSAIAWLLRSNPRHPLMRSPGARADMARDIGTAASEHNIDIHLLTAMAFLESTFLPGVTGKLGEVGLIQVARHVRTECERDGLIMTAPLDQLRCGARHLRRQIDRCGNLRGGLAAYASSRCQAMTGTRVAASVNIRIWRMRQLASRPWR